MNPSELNSLLVSQLGELPPPEEEIGRYTPWHHAMTCLLWGHILSTFRFEAFFLQYLLPLLGAILIFLGSRTLRRTNLPFRLCWLLSILRLALEGTDLVLNATPLRTLLHPDHLSPAASLCIALWSLVQPLCLYLGIRQGFRTTSGKPGRNRLFWGLLACAASSALAFWAQLVPLTTQSPFGAVPDSKWFWLHQLRAWGALILQGIYLVCLYGQGKDLEGRGYTISPAPVRISSRTAGLAAFLVPLVLIPPLLFFSSRLPMQEPQAADQALTGAESRLRGQLVSLGLPADLAAQLDGAELERCRDARDVSPLELDRVVTRLDLTDDGRWVTVPFADQEIQVTGYSVLLPDFRVRNLFFFRSTALPGRRLQEMLSLHPSSDCPVLDPAARLFWTAEDVSWTSVPEILLGGGETEAEINWDTVLLPETTRKELENLGGHLQVQPQILWSFPADADTFSGWMAFTNQVKSDPLCTSASTVLSLLHQKHWRYPFTSPADMQVPTPDMEVQQMLFYWVRQPEDFRA